jgi:hypothetical protein
MRLSTPGWAAQGQSVAGRWLDCAEWFAIGFVPGCLIGALITAVWLLLKRR